MVTKATAAVAMAAVLVAKAMVEAMAVANTVKVLQTGEAARHGLRGCASAHAVYLYYFLCIGIISSDINSDIIISWQGVIY